jgi:hypothetical protein
MDIGIPEIGRNGEDGGDGHDDDKDLVLVSRIEGVGYCNTSKAAKTKTSIFGLSTSQVHLGAGW